MKTKIAMMSSSTRRASRRAPAARSRMLRHGLVLSAYLGAVACAGPAERSERAVAPVQAEPIAATSQVSAARFRWPAEQVGVLSMRTERASSTPAIEPVSFTVDFSYRVAPLESGELSLAILPPAAAGPKPRTEQERSRVAQEVSKALWMAPVRVSSSGEFLGLSMRRELDEWTRAIDEHPGRDSSEGAPPASVIRSYYMGLMQLRAEELWGELVGFWIGTDLSKPLGPSPGRPILVRSWLPSGGVARVTPTIRVNPKVACDAEPGDVPLATGEGSCVEVRMSYPLAAEFEMIGFLELAPHLGAVSLGSEYTFLGGVRDVAVVMDPDTMAWRSFRRRLRGSFDKPRGGEPLELTKTVSSKLTLVAPSRAARAPSNPGFASGTSL